MERIECRFIMWWFKLVCRLPVFAVAKKPLRIRHLFAYEYSASEAGEKQD